MVNVIGAPPPGRAPAFPIHVPTISRESAVVGEEGAVAHPATTKAQMITTAYARAFIRSPFLDVNMTGRPPAC
jgi:hypothetical protein